MRTCTPGATLAYGDSCSRKLTVIAMSTISEYQPRATYLRAGGPRRACARGESERRGGRVSGAVCGRAEKVRSQGSVESAHAMRERAC